MNLQPLEFFSVVFLLCDKKGITVRGGIFLLCLLFTCPALAQHKKTEREYVVRYCHGAREFKLADNTRVDCLTDEYATEFDFAPKWAEALGQSLHYARMTGRLPAIYIIMETQTERFVGRLTPLCDDLNIKLVLIKNY